LFTDITIERNEAGKNFKLTYLEGHDLLIDKNLTVYGVWFGSKAGDVRQGLGFLYSGCGKTNLSLINPSLK
jgi:hypothetical protein